MKEQQQQQEVGERREGNKSVCVCDCQRVRQCSPSLPSTHFSMSWAALHSSMYLFEQTRRWPPPREKSGGGRGRGEPRTAASERGRESERVRERQRRREEEGRKEEEKKRSGSSCLNALRVHGRCPNPGPALPLSRELT